MPTGTDTVVDLSHHNTNLDFAKAKQGGIYGVIHKATQGQSGVDGTYALRRPQAEAAGLRWGAYHFGTGSDGVEQAESFLTTVGDPKGLLLVLDLEGNPTGPSMSLEEARAFLVHVKDKTGRWPGLYSGHYIKELLGTAKDPVLASCWFWLAQYGPTAVVPPNWETWTLWQYTDGSIPNPPTETPGLGHCDKDRFNGSADELKAFWDSGVPRASIV
jgi:lysozyme